MVHFFFVDCLSQVIFRDQNYKVTVSKNYSFQNQFKCFCNSIDFLNLITFDKIKGDSPTKYLPFSNIICPVLKSQSIFHYNLYT